MPFRLAVGDGLNGLMQTGAGGDHLLYPVGQLAAETLNIKVCIYVSADAMQALTKFFDGLSVYGVVFNPYSTLTAMSGDRARRHPAKNRSEKSRPSDPL